MIYFSNPGTIDLRLITMLGVNVKENSSPIGQFGTGLKYAIAGVLRLGGQIRIYSGDRQIDFRTVSQTIRGKEFQCIEMIRRDENLGDGYDVLAFTTELGKHWEPWMLYCELWSNCRDEGGIAGHSTLESLSSETCHEGETLITVVCPELDQVYLNRQDHFLSSEPLWSNETLSIHPRIASPICYQDIRMSDPTGTNAYTYNLLSMQSLTEDRTLANTYSAKRAIACGIMQCTDRVILQKILKSKWELSLDYDWYGVETLSEEFIDECMLLVGNKNALNPSIRAVLKRHKPERMEQTEHAVPSNWSEMIAMAPESTSKPPTDPGIYLYLSEMKNTLDKALRSERYWRDCAAKLAGSPIVPFIEQQEDIDSPPF